MERLENLIHYEVIAKRRSDWRLAIDALLQGRRQIFEAVVAAIQQELPVVANFMRASALYRLGGQQVFSVGPRLRDMLHETGASSIPKEKLRLPYPCCYVVFPDCPWRMWGGERTQMHFLSGAYLAESDRGITFLLWGRANERSLDPSDDSSFNLGLDISEIPSTPSDPSCYDIDRYLDMIMNDSGREVSDPHMSPPEGPIRDEQAQTVQSAVRTLTNLILYLNSTNAEIERKPGVDASKLQSALKRAKGSKKQKKIERQIQKTLGPKVIWVGRSMEQTPKEASGATRNGNTGTWIFRRGHFHHFWAGPKKDTDGNPQKGTHQVLQWLPPVRRDQAAVVASQTRIHRIKGEEK